MNVVYKTERKKEKKHGMKSWKKREREREREKRAASFEVQQVTLFKARLGGNLRCVIRPSSFVRGWPKANAEAQANSLMNAGRMRDIDISAPRTFST